MADNAIGALPGRAPFRFIADQTTREAWLKLGGREISEFSGSRLTMIWEVRVDHLKAGAGGMPVPKTVFVVTSSAGGLETTNTFDTLEQADAYFETTERRMIINSAIDALGIEP